MCPVVHLLVLKKTPQAQTRSCVCAKRVIVYWCSLLIKLGHKQVAVSLGQHVLATSKYIFIPGQNKYLGPPQIFALHLETVFSIQQQQVMALLGGMISILFRFHYAAAVSTSNAPQLNKMKTIQSIRFYRSQQRRVAKLLREEINPNLSVIHSITQGWMRSSVML